MLAKSPHGHEHDHNHCIPDVLVIVYLRHSDLSSYDILRPSMMTYHILLSVVLCRCSCMLVFYSNYHRLPNRVLNAPCQELNDA